MADKSKIEWTEASWNPIRGCSRVSDGCRHCYAEGQAARIIKMDRGRGVPDGDGSYDGLLAKGGQWNGQIKVVDSAMDQPLRWKRPRKIFVNSMSDLFHENVQDDVIDRVFDVMARAPQHTYQILTKRPERMMQYLNDAGRPHRAGSKFFVASDGTSSPWPLANVWLGVSVEDNATARERIPFLLQSPAAVRWLSIEPLLGPISMRWFPAWPENPPYTAENPYNGGGTNHLDGLRRLDWIVVGGESGPKARPMHPQWVRVLRDQCAEAGVPFLFKQWGEWAPGENVERASGLVPIASLVGGEWKIGMEDLASLGGHVDDEPDLYRIGKGSAGRLLDGELHDGYPGTRSA